MTGNAKKDYESIIAKCGAATGAVEYVKPALGKLHIKHDKRDTFIVPIRGGLCYRFFGVADASIQDLDILIEKKGETYAFTIDGTAVEGDAGQMLDDVRLAVLGDAPVEFIGGVSFDASGFGIAPDLDVTVLRDRILRVVERYR